MKSMIRVMTGLLAVIVLLCSIPACSSTPSNESHALIDALRSDGFITDEIDMDAPVTNEQFLALLVTGFDWTAQQDLQAEETWLLRGDYAPYYVAALQHGVISADELDDGGKTAVGTDIVSWTRRAMCLQIGMDELFSSVPAEAVTVREAIALIERAAAQYTTLHSLRADASNTVTLQDTVRFTVADNGHNIPIAVDEERAEITMDNPDEVVRSLAVGEVLYVPPCEAYPDGFLTKVVAASEQNGRVTLTCEAPSAGEVLKEVDISADIPIVGSIVEDATTGELTFEHLYGDIVPSEYYTDEGRCWSLFGALGEKASVHMETKTFAEKKGPYASLDLSATLRINANIVATGMDVKTFLVAASVDSEVTGVFGYQKSASVEPIRLDIMTVTVPVAGPLSVELTPFLYVTASGEFYVEFTSSLINTTTFGYGMTEGSFGGTVSTATVTGEANAEGMLETGVGIEAGFGLNGVPFLDGLHLFEAEAVFGMGARGETEVDKQGRVDSNGGANYSGNETEPNENGEVHTCSLCIKGEFYCEDSLTLRPDQDLCDWLKAETGLDASLTFGPTDYVLTPWYYSVGKDHDPDWSIGYCPYKAYEVVVTAKVKQVEENITSEKPLGGVKIRISDEEFVTDVQGTAKLYLPKGLHQLVAQKSAQYKPNPLTKDIFVDRATTVELVFETDGIDYYEFIKTELLPQYGWASLQEQTTIQTVDNYFSGEADDDWDNRSGLVGADVADMNGDGTDDLLVYHICLDEEADQKSLYVTVYTVNENAEIVELVQESLGTIGGFNGAHRFLGIKQLNGKNYLFIEYAYRSCFVSGSSRGIMLYGFDDLGEWGSIFAINKSAGGTSEIAYSLYDASSGKTVETLIYADSGYRAYNEDAIVLTPEGTSLAEAFTVALNQIGWDVEIGSFGEYDQSWFRNNSDVKESVLYCITYGDAAFKEYAFQATLTDHTNLKAMIEDE